MARGKIAAALGSLIKEIVFHPDGMIRVQARGINLAWTLRAA